MSYFWLFATVSAFGSGPLFPFVLLFACILQLLISFPVPLFSLFCLFALFLFFRDPLVALWRSLVGVWEWYWSEWDPRTLQAMRDNEEAEKFVVAARAYWKVVDLAGAPLYAVACVDGPDGDEVASARGGELVSGDVVSARGGELVSGVAPVSAGVVSARGVVTFDEDAGDVSAFGVAVAFARAGVEGVRASGVDGGRDSVGARVASVVRELFPAPAAAEDADVGFGDEEDVLDELAFLFSHMTVNDPFDEDVYMAPPIDRPYVEPMDVMDVDDDLLSVMSVRLDNSPFFEDDDDPIIIDMPSPQLPPQAATPPPSPPPSPTPIPMEVDPTIVSPIITPAAETTTTTNTTTVTMPMPMPTPIPVISTTTDTATVTSPPHTPVLTAMSVIQARLQRIRQTVLTPATPSSNSATPSSTATTMPTTHATVSTSSRPLVYTSMPPPPPRPRRITLTVTPPTTSSSSTANTTPSSSRLVRPDMPPPPPRPPRAIATPSSSSRPSSTSSSSNTATPSSRSEPAQQQQQHATTTTTTTATPQPSSTSDVREAQKALGLLD